MTSSSNPKPDTPELAILHFLLKTQGPLLDRVKPRDCSTSFEELTADVVGGYGPSSKIYPSSIRTEIEELIEKGLISDVLPVVDGGIRKRAIFIQISPKGIVRARDHWPGLGVPRKLKVDAVEVKLGEGFFERGLRSVRLSAVNEDFRRTFRTVRFDGYIYLLLHFHPTWEKEMLEYALKVYEKLGWFHLHFPGSPHEGVSRAGFNNALCRLTDWFPMINEFLEGRKKVIRVTEELPDTNFFYDEKAVSRDKVWEALVEDYRLDRVPTVDRRNKKGEKVGDIEGLLVPEE